MTVSLPAAAGSLPVREEARSATPGIPALRGMEARHVLWAGSAVAALLVLLLLAFVSYGRVDRIRTEQGRTELLARVLEDHATRSIETAALALSALAELVGSSRFEPDGPLVWVLNQTLAGLPVLRSLTVIDSEGRVLVSTELGLANQVVDRARLGPLPKEGTDSLGRFVPGRGIAALVGTGESAVPPGVGFVPLLRSVRSTRGAQILLVGLINPDAIANHQQQVLSDAGVSAMLLSLDAQVLAATASAALQPGESAPVLPVFKRYLPAVEHGSYVGAGTWSGEQVLAFRASRTRPVLVVVETPVWYALAEWRRESISMAAIMLLVVAALAVMTSLTSRSLLARETVRAQRDAAQAEVARRESELSTIASSVQELLFRTDREGRLVFVNARWDAVAGLGGQQALGQMLAQVVHAGSAPIALSLFADGDSSGIRSGLVRMGSPGQERDFQVAVAPLRQGDRVTGFAGSAVDVTEQRQAQAQLRSQLEFTELLLEVLPLPLSILDNETRYVSVNQAWLEFTGRQRIDVIGRPAGQFQPEADARVHEAQDRLVWSSGGRVNYESGNMRRDGQRRDLSTTKAAVPGPDGKPSRILAVSMDVTEFREAERATRVARDAAEEASRSKNEFVANISHELRTPLQSILGFSELGLERSTEHARLNMMFGDIHAAGQRMLSLVNDLLDVAKIESTVGSIQLQRTDLRPLVRAVAAELAPQMAAARLHLQQQLGDTPLVARVDPPRLQQVVRNVLANAIRFSPPGSTVLLAGSGGHDQPVRLSVTDSGPGIPPAELEKIFEAFVQSSLTKDGSGGTGLGLAISRKIVHAHGGEIRAENNAQGGASFHIQLPASGVADSA